MKRKVGLRRINRELDIVHFLRKQIIFETIIKAMTTKYERFLARKNYRLMVPDTDELLTTTESDSGFEQIK